MEEGQREMQTSPEQEPKVGAIPGPHDRDSSSLQKPK